MNKNTIDGLNELLYLLLAKRRIASRRPMKASDGPVVVEESFEATADAVWRAITEPDLMRQWYFENAH